VHRHAHWEKGVVAVDRLVDHPEEAVAAEDNRSTDQMIMFDSAQLVVNGPIDRPACTVEPAQSAVDCTSVLGCFLLGF